MRRHTFRAMMLATSACLLASPAVWAATDEIGTAAAVNPDSFGFPPNAERRTLLVGADVVFRERIQTFAGGQTQILFVDESSLTIGPNSEILLDEFVYDPAAKSGRLSVTAAQGLLRYVGGRISKGGGVAFKTPVATIGVRGGGMLLDMRAPDGTIRVIPTIGQTTIRRDIAQSTDGSLRPGIGIIANDNGEETVLTDPSMGAEISPDGSISTFSVDFDQITELLQNLQGGNSDTINNESTDEQFANNPDSAPSDGIGDDVQQTTTTTTTTGGTSNNQISEVTDEVQTATQNQTTNQQPPPGIPFAGRYMQTPPPYTTSTGEFIADPLAQNYVGGPNPAFNIPFSQPRGRLVTTTSEFRVDLDPGTAGDELILPVGPAGTPFVIAPGAATTPLGGIPGVGILGPGNTFYGYALHQPGVGTISLHGGVPTPTTNPALANGSIDAYVLLGDPVLDADIPFLPASVADQFPNAAMTDFLIARQSSGILGDSPAGVGFSSHTFWAAFAVEGQGPGQKSLLMGSDGALSTTSPGTVNAGIGQGIRGSYRFGSSSTDLPYFVSGGLGSVPDGNGDSFYGPGLDFFVLDQNNPDLDGTSNVIQFPLFRQPFDNLGNFETNGFREAAVRDATPFPVANRSSQTLHGYFGVLGRQRDFDFDGNSGSPKLTISAPYMISTENALPGSLRIQTDATRNSMEAEFSFEKTAGVFDPLGGATVSDGRFTFGGLGAFRGSYIDDNTFGARNTNVPSLAGDIDGAQGSDFEFNSDGFRSFMVVQAAVPATNFLPDGVTFCQCDYLKWGYWTSEFRWDPNQLGDPANDNRRERFHIGTWVAGDLPTELEVPTTGNALFDGHIIGNVYNNIGGADAEYIAVGNFEASWDFNSRTGDFAALDFDNTNFTGGLIASKGGSAVNFETTTLATGTGPGATPLSLDIDGSFFKGPTSNAQYMGGQGVIVDTGTNGMNYRAITTFAAEGTPFTPQ